MNKVRASIFLHIDESADVKVHALRTVDGTPYVRVDVDNHPVDVALFFTPNGARAFMDRVGSALGGAEAKQ